MSGFIGGRSAEAEVPSVVVSARVRGTTGFEIVELRVADRVVATWSVGEEFAELSFVHPGPIGDRELTIGFVNDGRSGGVDRNVHVDWVEVGGQRFEAEAATTFSTGTWSRGDGCRPGFKKRDVLHCNGALAFAIGDAGSGDRAGAQPSTTVIAPTVTSTTVVPSTTVI